MDIAIGLPADALAGDVLTVTIDGVESDGVLTSEEVEAGTIALTTSAPADGATLVASARVTDAADNVSPDGLDEATMDLSAPPVPTVNVLVSASETPVLTGSAVVDANDVLSVRVNGTTYIAGGGHLADNGDGTWTLIVPTIAPVPEGVHDVTVTVTDAAGNGSVDTSAGELTVDTTAPVVPTVTMSLTNAAAPTIEGTATLGAGEMLTVNVDGVTYVAGDGALVDNGDGTWTLTLPEGALTDDGTYEVIATVTDAAGNATSDGMTSDLVLDRTAPGAPTVTIAEDANDDGTIAIAELAGDIDVMIGLPAEALAGDVLTVTIDGVESDGVLTSEEVEAGTIALTTSAPADGATLVASARVTDAADNVSPDGLDEATMDLSAPPVPTVNVLVSGSETPTLSGTATVDAGDVLSVRVNGTTYIAGGGHLADNGDGTWTLIVPTIAPVPEGVHDVTVTVTDVAGNDSVDTSSSELTIDLTAPVAPTVTMSLTNAAAPTIEGTVTLAELAGDIDVMIGLPGESPRRSPTWRATRAST